MKDLVYDGQKFTCTYVDRLKSALDEVVFFTSFAC